LKLNLASAIVILLVAFAVLSGIQAAVQTVDPATLPKEWQPIQQGVIYVFTTSAASILFTFIRNILGYAEHRIGGHIHFNNWNRR
jgi:hypothetical protein